MRPVRRPIQLDAGRSKGSCVGAPVAPIHAVQLSPFDRDATTTAHRKTEPRVGLGIRSAFVAGRKGEFRIGRRVPRTCRLGTRRLPRKAGTTQMQA